jgi:CCR4-NOT transcription complex subunit 6
MQEVEQSQFDQFFKPQFRMRGNYDGVFSPKSRARTMSEWDRTFVDGCAIFFKADKFKLEEKHLIEFNQLALARPSLRKHKDMYNRVMTRDNISLVTRLEHRESRQELIVGNVHVHWDPTFCDVKLVQSILLIEELEKLCNKHPKASLLLCGDFNSLPDSGVYNLLESGSICPGHEDFMNYTYEPYSTEGAQHTLNLKSAYSNCPESVDLTIMTPKFKGVIDYIWYKPSSLNVSGILGPVHQEYTKQLVGFPSQHLPSDHISLLVEFKMDPPSFGSTGHSRREPGAFHEANQAKRLYSRNKHQS